MSLKLVKGVNIIESLSKNLEAIDLKNYQFAMFTNTANKRNKDQILPDRLTPFGRILNIQIASSFFAQQVFKQVDGVIPHLLVDAERKQPVELYQIAWTSCSQSEVHPFKANDVTVNATINTLMIYFSNQLDNLSATVYGTGNLAIKIALKLAELGVNTYVAGRNLVKVEQLVNALNLILPAYVPQSIKVFQENKRQASDVFISAISAKQQLDSNWLGYLKEEAFIMDVGIDNFSEAFIENAIKRGCTLQRIDIQASMGTEIANIETSDFYANKIRGIRYFNGETAVAGGIIGKRGDIVLNKITEPFTIIGLSNGTGGLEPY
ncbi:hypothetical protein MAQA_14849 [Listeria aquatica FSL S10-1188]|uniref:Quinate/shikimate 5-dehydrogenase/glutamyl-tRNA reductase domain-containing protein n=1 Tax=Listeria aquatica FSL S10-1188 TaxID=1265818 RepID=W7ANY6_9LIST|nr:hypothetical protein MAQA_14849 [Listeria aquatica FSL S10-1188]